MVIGHWNIWKSHIIEGTTEKEFMKKLWNLWWQWSQFKTRTCVLKNKNVFFLIAERFQKIIFIIASFLFSKTALFTFSVVRSLGLFLYYTKAFKVSRSINRQDHSYIKVLSTVFLPNFSLIKTSFENSFNQPNWRYFKWVSTFLFLNFWRAF